ncbi:MULTISPECIES: hypothetical protein [Pseudomonas]|jgi:hypothetical protein|uniref:Uncharacterized protein n=3 Tax=Pseudomonas TaxID=286 RepID=A0A1L7NP64_PSEPU|nr:MULTISPECIES: hypothetical protein [Pseudomonas]HCF2574561.1 hypothetical protein [Pseudomonas aeruginosa]AGN82409.1 hypothetical protein L483_15865 [Pseudomonas putida H8234]ELS0926877.1 hypothetical protein [Pseudomonas putida]ENY78155.1 hypothetical protein C206_08469 [Pseudomonas putida TRO1]KYC17467.1 hypothetical protein WM94_21750 [Pseudomonas sp. ABFPK]
MPLRSQQAWCLVVAICTVVFYILLSAYTADLANPRPIFWGILLSYGYRVYSSVRYDLHAQSAKEVGLLSIAAMTAVALAMFLRPLALQAVFAFERDPEATEVVAAFKEYFVVVHNPVFGIPAFFIGFYMATIRVLRMLGKRLPILAFPRSTFEMYGAYYAAAHPLLSDEAQDAIHSRARRILAQTEGFYKGPSPNKLL